MAAIQQVFEYVKIPGVFWLALIGFAITWLPQLAPGAPWLSTVLLLLCAVLKAAEVIVTGLAPTPTTRADADLFDFWRRLIFG